MGTVEAGIGEGKGERPDSEISVLAESVPGDALLFHVKKDVILLPGVLGCCLYSLAGMLREVGKSTRSGAGLFVGGCKAIVVEGLWSDSAGDGGVGGRGSITGSVTRRT